MKKDTIEILRVISDKELGKVEQAIVAAHITEFTLDRRGGKTTLVVPKEKTPRVFQNLIKLGVIE